VWIRAEAKLIYPGQTPAAEKTEDPSGSPSGATDEASK
jgi:hypothetical protein